MGRMMIAAIPKMPTFNTLFGATTLPELESKVSNTDRIELYMKRTSHLSILVEFFYQKRY